MVYPGMVYISHPTEYGTLYTKSELEELSEICREYDMVLYADGARLGYGLAAKQTDVTLPVLSLIHILAKANKIRVDEFSLGLGPTLFGKVIGGTKFSLKLLPFGGACMMGEDDADDMSEGSFNSKSVWARMSEMCIRDRITPMCPPPILTPETSITESSG